jgi:hypothetical protein
MMIGNETYGKLSGKKAVDVVKEINRKEKMENKNKQQINFSNN